MNWSLWFNNRFRFLLGGLFWLFDNLSFEVVVHTNYLDLEYESRTSWNETIANVPIAVSKFRRGDDDSFGSHSETNETFIPCSYNLSLTCYEAERFLTEVAIEYSSVC